MKAWQKKSTYALLIVLVIVYLLNTTSWVRLNTDATRYLMILEYIKGNPYFINAKNDFYPHGYPRLLQAMDALGILRKELTLLINLISLLGGTYFFCKILNVRDIPVVLVFSLLCWVNINHFALGIPDLLFMMTSAVSLYCFQLFLENRRRRDLVFFFIGTAISIYLRTAGVFIPLAITLFLWYKNIRKINPFLQIGFVISSLAVVIFNWSSLKTKVDYLRQLDIDALFGPGEMNLLGRLRIHTIELGEIAANIGIAKLSLIVPANIAPVILLLSGIAAMVVIVHYIIKQKIYEKFIFWPILTYSGIIFVWPFYDARFFIPIIPFLLIAFIHTMQVNWKPLRLAAIPFILIGLASLAFCSRLSLDKDYFVNNYSTKHLQGIYSKYRNGVTPAAADTTLYLLRKYN